MPKKPSSIAISAATPLTKYPARSHDPITDCNLCGQPSTLLGAWREHDERDVPFESPEALVFIAADHPDCLKVMERHPRLYAEERGDPGHFPRLCGTCPRRSSLACTHPNLRANGGAGLFVVLDDRFRNAILCGRGGRVRPIQHALQCEGHPDPALKAVRNIPAYSGPHPFEEDEEDDLCHLCRARADDPIHGSPR